MHGWFDFTLSTDYSIFRVLPDIYDGVFYKIIEELKTAILSKNFHRRRLKES